MNNNTKFANSILILGIAVSLLYIFFTISKNSFAYTGIMNPVFYGAIISTLLFAIILFKCKPELKNGLVLVIISSVICIYSAEILLEKINPSIEKKAGWLQRIEAAKNAGVPFDSRTKVEILMDLRKEDRNIYHAIGPSAFTTHDGYLDKETRIHPMGSVSNKTLVACNEHGEWLTFKSDRHGFRNPQDVYDSPVDIALIGDSFTEGLCVKDGEDIAGWLRQQTGLNILNLGYGSNSSLIELASMKEFAAPFKPKVVLMFYYAGNDMESLPNETVSPILMQYLDKNFTQNLIEKQELADRIIINVHENRLKLLKKDFKQRPVFESKISSKISWARIMELKNLISRLGMDTDCSFYIPSVFKDILVRADSMAKEWNGQFIFVYLTGAEKNLSEDRNDVCRSKFYASQRKKLFPLLKELGISFIDIDEVLSNHPDPYSLYPSFFHGHHNSNGYRLIAETVSKYIAQNNFVYFPQE